MPFSWGLFVQVETAQRTICFILFLQAKSYLKYRPSLGKHFGPTVSKKSGIVITPSPSKSILTKIVASCSSVSSRPQALKKSPKRAYLIPYTPLPWMSLKAFPIVFHCSEILRQTSSSSQSQCRQCLTPSSNFEISLSAFFLVTYVSCDTFLELS